MTSRDQSCPGQSLAMASWNGAMRKISVDTATHPKSYKFIQIPCCCRMCRTNISPPAQHNITTKVSFCFFWISDGYLLGSNLSIPNCHWSFWAPQSRAKRPNRERYIIVSKSTFVDDTNDAIDTVVAVGPVGLSSSFSTYLTGPCKEKINQPQTTTNIIPVVPHKAVAEVSKIGNYRRGELLWCMGGRANALMDRKMAVIFGVAAVVASPTAAGCSMV